MSDTPEGRQHSALPHGEPCVVVISGPVSPGLHRLSRRLFLPSALRATATNGAPSASPGTTAMPEGVMLRVIDAIFPKL